MRKIAKIVLCSILLVAFSFCFISCSLKRNDQKTEPDVAEENGIKERYHLDSIPFTLSFFDFVRLGDETTFSTIEKPIKSKDDLTFFADIIRDKDSYRTLLEKWGNKAFNETDEKYDQPLQTILRKYDDDFFAENALFLCATYLFNRSYEAMIDSLWVENDILMVAFSITPYPVETAAQPSTIVIEIKKDDVKDAEKAQIIYFQRKE